MNLIKAYRLFLVLISLSSFILVKGSDAFIASDFIILEEELTEQEESEIKEAGVNPQFYSKFDDGGDDNNVSLLSSDSHSLVLNYKIETSCVSCCAAITGLPNLFLLFCSLKIPFHYSF